MVISSVPPRRTNRKPGFQGPAAGGRIQEFDWDGNLVWDFEYHSEKRLPHHDAIKLPNGNALLICWEMIDEKEAVAQGRRPETVKDSHLQPDCLVEIKPTGKNDRRSRLGMAKLGSPHPGPRQDQAQLRQCLPNTLNCSM